MAINISTREWIDLMGRVRAIICEIQADPIVKSTSDEFRQYVDDLLNETKSMVLEIMAAQDDETALEEIFSRWWTVEKHLLVCA